MERWLAASVAMPRPLSRALGIATFTLLMVLSAYLALPLPFTPVPITLQTLVVLISAGMLGRWAAVSQALYLALGAIGLPVFAGAWGGLARMCGPTGGYLSGFVLTAYFVGWSLERGRRRLIRTLLAMVLGASAILLLGTLRLALLFRLNFAQAAGLGCWPFAAIEMIKAVAAAALVNGYRRP
jgi:biotin transport system substrate-specific component